MVRLKHSTSCYDDVGELVNDIQADVDRISTVLVRSREDFLNDCKQTLYVHAIETYNDSTAVLPYQQLINKMWWRAMDFVKRDQGFNFWRVHVPYSEHLSVSAVHPRFVTRYVRNPSVEAKLDVENIIDYASKTLSERDFVVFVLHLEGLSFTEISKIVYPTTYSDLRSVRRIKSALWRIRKRFKVIME